MKRAAVQPLSAFTSGQKGTVVTLTGGRMCHERLKSMGLHIGSEFEIINCGAHGGPVMVAVGETRLAIGRGMAEKILAAVTCQEQVSDSFARKGFRRGWMMPFCRKMRLA